MPRHKTVDTYGKCFTDSVCDSEYPTTFAATGLRLTWQMEGMATCKTNITLRVASDNQSEAHWIISCGDSKCNEEIWVDLCRAFQTATKSLRPLTGGVWTRLWQVLKTNWSPKWVANRNQNDRQPSVILISIGSYKIMLHTWTTVVCIACCTTRIIFTTTITRFQVYHTVLQ